MKAKRLVLLAVLLFMTALPVLAQIDINPCGGADPDDVSSDCPIDNWVIALAAPSLFFGYKSIQKQKSLTVIQ